ncbi:hypothetical protein JHK87_017426 [Glycine soja]|nr:hypothetical protein JHK87_017426 [Glycine soja]
MQIFPTNVRNLWNEWELRVMVLASLSFHSILILLGNKRKYCTRTILRITLWFAYLLAEWLATFSLGVLSNKVGENEGDFVEPKYVIISLWAPILPLHLGGSDTIIAYSMEDNELWSRRFLSFCVQVVMALYIFLRAWTNTDLNILAIPIFIAGPNYAKDMETYIAASHEGFIVDVQGLKTHSVGDDHTHAPAEANIIPLPQTHDSYGPEISFENGNGKKVFQVIEVELGFMYDLFYTKAAVTYSFMGSFLRLVTLSCHVRDCPLLPDLHKLKNLKNIKLAFQLTETEKEILAEKIVQLNQLHSLKLRSVNEIGDPKKLIVNSMSKLENLSSLQLFGKLEDKLHMRCLPQNLTNLTFSKSKLSEDPMPELQSLLKLKSLCFYEDSSLD